MPQARQVMSKNVVSCERSLGLQTAVARMVENQIGAVVVTDAEVPVGIFSERDLLTRVVAKNLDAGRLTVGDVMTGGIYIAQASDELDQVFGRMRELNIRHVPIVEHNQVVGMISLRDLLAARQHTQQHTKVGTWMTQRPVTVTREEPLVPLIKRMAERNIGAVVVVDSEGEGVIGIFTERDLLTKVISRQRDPALLLIGDVMTANPTTASVTDEFDQVYDTLNRLKVRHLPIVDGRRLVGIVSLRDIFQLKERILERTVEDKAALLNHYQELLSREDKVAQLLYEAERLRAQAVTDELTGLYNFRYFQQRIEEEVDRARRYGRPLTLCIGDIDHFKRINDTYGHPAGDEVLRDVAQLLNKSLGVLYVLTSFRKSDIVARYGGEEFVIILPETQPDRAQLACERVRVSIENYGFLAKQGGPPVKVTMSFGVASFPVHADTKEDLLRRADEALYRAKNAGRNRTVVAAIGGAPA